MGGFELYAVILLSIIVSIFGSIVFEWNRYLTIAITFVGAMLIFMALEVFRDRGFGIFIDIKKKILSVYDELLSLWKPPIDPSLRLKVERDERNLIYTFVSSNLNKIEEAVDYAVRKGKDYTNVEFRHVKRTDVFKITIDILKRDPRFSRVRLYRTNVIEYHGVKYTDFVVYIRW